MELRKRKYIQKQKTFPENNGTANPLDPPEKSDRSKKRHLFKYIAPAVVFFAAASVFFIGGNYIKSGNADSLSQEEVTKITRQYNEAIEKGVSFVRPVDFMDPNEREEAKIATGLPEKEAEALMQKAEGGITYLGWVTVWDNYAEDGDVVEVSSGGLKRRVPISHTPTTIVVPYDVHAATLTITGVHDGGGGITAAAKTKGGQIPFPPLKVGETKILTIN